MTIKISIITVCYNSAATIRDTIESILSQSFTNIEYIIIDGGSNDGTMDIVRDYNAKIDKVVTEKDRGIYDAMNKGVGLATGDIVGILNSDDFFNNENVLSDVASIFQTKDDIDIVFGDVVFVKPDGLEKIVRHYNSAYFKSWKLRFGWMPPHPATFVKRSIYEKYGLYKLHYKIAADYEMFVRWLLVNQLNYFRINKVLVRMRTGGISTKGFKSSLLLNKEIVTACQSNGIYTNLLFVLSKIPFKIMEFFRRPQSAP